MTIEQKKAGLQPEEKSQVIKRHPTSEGFTPRDASEVLGDYVFSGMYDNPGHETHTGAYFGYSDRYAQAVMGRWKKWLEETEEGQAMLRLGERAAGPKEDIFSPWSERERRFMSHFGLSGSQLGTLILKLDMDVPLGFYELRGIGIERLQKADCFVREDIPVYRPSL